MPSARRSRALSCALVLMLALTLLAPLATPAVAVSPATIKGYLREPGGAGIRDGEVVAIATDDENYGELYASITATDGIYEMELPAGTYVFAGVARDHFGGYASGSSFANARRYNVAAGATVTGVNVAIERKSVTPIAAEGTLVGPKAATRLLRKSAPRVSGRRAIYSDANQLLLSDFSSGTPQESILSTWSADSYDIGSTYAFADDMRIALASGEATQVTGAMVQSLSCDDTYVAYVIHDYDEEAEEETYALDVHRVSDRVRVRRIPLDDETMLAPGAVSNGRVALTLANERVLVYDIASGSKLRDLGVPDPQTAVVGDVSAVLAGDRLVWTDSIRAFAATISATPGTSTIADVSGTNGRVIGMLHSDGARVGYSAWTQTGTQSDFSYKDLEIRAHDFSSGADSSLFTKALASDAKPEAIFDISAESAAWLDPLVTLDDLWSEDWSLGEGVWGTDGGAPVRIDTERYAFNSQTQPQLAGGRVAWLDNGPYDTNEAKWDLLARRVDSPDAPTVVEAGLYSYYEDVMALGTEHLAYLKPALSADDEMASELWVYSFADATKLRIERDLESCTMAMDGDWLVYNTQKAFGAPSLKARDLSGSTVRTILASEYSEMPFRVCRGTVYYADDLGDVWAYDLATGTKRVTLLDPASLWAGALDKPHFVGTTGAGGEDWMWGSMMGSLDLGNFETGERFVLDPFSFSWWGEKRMSGRWVSIDSEILDITSGRYYRLPGEPGDTRVSALLDEHVVQTEWDEEDSSSAKVFDISSITSPTRRVFGANRVGTSVALSQETAEATTVVIATARNFPDALAGAPLAHALKAPVLLTEPGGLSPAVAAEVQRLGAEKAYVLGSTSAVAGSVDASLVALGLTVERLEGGNRYATARAIALELRDVVGHPLETAFIATGRNFPDALGASAVAARMEAPILLTEFGYVPQPTKDAIREIGAPGAPLGSVKIMILGSDKVISAAAQAQLPVPPGPANRIAGADRYDTARKVAEYGYGKGVLDADSFVFAIGNDFPDALGAGAVAAARGDALLLVNRAYPAALPSPVAALMAAKKSSVTRPSIVVGSEAALQLQLQQKISAALP